jgi:hypothetical protein
MGRVNHSCTIVSILAALGKAFAVAIRVNLRICLCRNGSPIDKVQGGRETPRSSHYLNSNAQDSSGASANDGDCTGVFHRVIDREALPLKSFCNTIGDRTQVEIAVPTKSSGYDIGFRKSGNAYEVVADCWGIHDIKQEQFLQQVNQRYAYHAARAKLEK